MRPHQRVYAELFKTPIINGRVAEELSIIKGFIMANLLAIAFSPFRGIIIKEATDSENTWKFSHILDNLLFIVLLLLSYLCARLIQRERIRTVLVILCEVILTLATLEISLYLKFEHRAVIDLLYLLHLFQFRMLFVFQQKRKHYILLHSFQFIYYIIRGALYKVYSNKLFCCAVFSEYMAILYIITIYMIDGHLTSLEELSKNQIKNQKYIDILKNIYHMLPLVVLKVNLNKNISKDLNDGLLKIYPKSNFSIMDEILVPNQIVNKIGINQEMNDKVITFKEKSLLVKIGPELSHKKQLIMLQDVSILSDIQKDRYKFAYISTATHELNTPLHSLLQALQLLEFNAVPGQEQYIQTAKRSVKSLNDIVVNGMTLMNIENGKVKLNLLSVEPQKLGASFIKAIKPEADLKGLRLSFRCDAGMPSIMLDKKLLRQVIMILLFNSLKYTMEGFIELVFNKINDKLFIQVHDSGIGIEESIIEKIFDPFSQQDRKIKSNETGMGLNLHLCKRIMSLMNGTIEVSSIAHKYTLFILQLPFIEKGNLMEDLQAEVGMSVSMSHKNLPTLPNFKTFVSSQLAVLIVDDNVTNVFVLSAFFQKLKVQFDTAYNGEKAVEAVTKKIYDIIFMDINMPVMNGIIATQKIRAYNKEHNRPKQAIYAVTAQKEDGITLMIEGSEFDDIYQKPMSLKLVQQIINSSKSSNGGYIHTEPDYT